jgi:hypothetical protein
VYQVEGRGIRQRDAHLGAALQALDLVTDDLQLVAYVEVRILNPSFRAFPGRR